MLTLGHKVQINFVCCIIPLTPIHLNLINAGHPLRSAGTFPIQKNLQQSTEANALRILLMYVQYRMAFFPLCLEARILVHSLHRGSVSILVLQVKAVNLHCVHMKLFLMISAILGSLTSTSARCELSLLAQEAATSLNMKLLVCSKTSLGQHKG